MAQKLRESEEGKIEVESKSTSVKPSRRSKRLTTQLRQIVADEGKLQLQKGKVAKNLYDSLIVDGYDPLSAREYIQTNVDIDYTYLLKLLPQEAKQKQDHSFINNSVRKNRADNDKYDGEREFETEVDESGRIQGDKILEEAMNKTNAEVRAEIIAEDGEPNESNNQRYRDAVTFCNEVDMLTVQLFNKLDLSTYEEIMNISDKLKWAETNKKHLAELARRIPDGNLNTHRNLIQALYFFARSYDQVLSEEVVARKKQSEMLKE